MVGLLDFTSSDLEFCQNKQTCIVLKQGPLILRGENDASISHIIQYTLDGHVEDFFGVKMIT